LKIVTRPVTGRPIPLFTPKIMIMMEAGVIPTGKPTFLGGLVLLIVTVSLPMLSMVAAANPIPIQQNPRYLNGATPLLLLLCLNFIVNLFLFSLLFLLLANMWRKNVGKLPPDRNKFILITLASVAGITLLGSLIDIGLLYGSSGSVLVLRYDAARWSIAVLLIFASIYLISHYFLKVRRRVSIMIGAAMGAVNLGYWYALLDTYDDPAFIPLLLLFVVPVLLFLIYRWHLKVYMAAEETPPAPEPNVREQAAEKPAAETAQDDAGDIEKAIDTLKG
jgi:hypothetical protein